MGTDRAPELGGEGRTGCQARRCGSRRALSGWPGASPWALASIRLVLLTRPRDGAELSATMKQQLHTPRVFTRSCSAAYQPFLVWPLIVERQLLTAV